MVNNVDFYIIHIYKICINFKVLKKQRNKVFHFYPVKTQIKTLNSLVSRLDLNCLTILALTFESKMKNQKSELRYQRWMTILDVCIHLRISLTIGHH